jgi:hypothetical protein
MKVFSTAAKVAGVLFLISVLPIGLFAQEGAYVNSISITQGDTLKFYVSTSSNPFSMRITRFLSNDVKVRMGDYNNLPGGIKPVPADAYMNGCRWPETFRMVIPDNWEPGMYRATFPNSVGGGGVIFFVKAKTPGSFSNTLLVLNTNTWQAYNDYGGKNLYPSNSSSRSYKVSFLRPSNHLWGAYNFFKHEMLYVDWTYNSNRKIEYATDYDIHANPGLLSKYKVVVFVGHAEYWSLNQRNNVQSYVNSGGKVMMLSGNTSWWQVRFEDNGNTLVCYKSRTADPLNGVSDELVTVNWYNSPVNNPENKVTGLSFRAGGYVNNGSTLPASQGYGDYAALNTHHWIYEGTGLKDGDEFAAGTVGNEVDGALHKWENGLPVVTGQDGTPLNYRIIGISPAYNPDPSFVNEHGLPGMYTTTSGGALFNAASIKWVFGLAGDNDVKKITNNVYTRFLSNSFPPDIISWSPYVIETATINKESLQLNRRLVSAKTGDNIRFSVKVSDYQNKTVNFRWYVGSAIVATDSVFNFNSGSQSQYNIRVVAYNDKDSSGISWIVNNDAVQTVPAVPQLASPANGTQNVSLSSQLSWNASSGAEYYDVQLSLSSGFENPIFTRRVTGLNTSVTLESSTTYFWRVRAGNSAGNSNYSNSWSFTSINSNTNLPPGDVVLVYPEKNQRNVPINLNFIWNRSDGADKYKLEISSDRQLRSILQTFPELTDTQKAVSGLQTKKNHYWRVTAYNNYGEAVSEVRQFATAGSEMTAKAGGVDGVQAYDIRTSNKRTISLLWHSESVISGEYFEIYIQGNDGKWEFMSVVDCVPGNPKYSFNFNPVQKGDIKIQLVKLDPEGSVISEVETEAEYIPEEYKIMQNYPNPFNPVTNIDFILPDDSRVKMNLYSITGELVRTLIDRTYTAGMHSYVLDGNNLSSGIYFYTFEATAQNGEAKHSSIKKLVLLK